MLVSHPSRADLLSWISELTQTNVQNIQVLSNGIQICQAFNTRFPASINLSKLNHDAQDPADKQRNFKLLLTAIDELKLPLSINIADLANGKISSITQLLKWMHKQFQKPPKDIILKSKESHAPRISSVPKNLIKTGSASKYMASKSRSLDIKLNTIKEKAQPETEKKSVKKNLQSEKKVGIQKVSKKDGIEFYQQREEKDSQKKELSALSSKQNSSQKQSRKKVKVLTLEERRQSLRLQLQEKKERINNRAPGPMSPTKLQELLDPLISPLKAKRDQLLSRLIPVRVVYLPPPVQFEEKAQKVPELPVQPPVQFEEKAQKVPELPVQPPVQFEEEAQEVPQEVPEQPAQQSNMRKIKMKKSETNPSKTQKVYSLIKEKKPQTFGEAIALTGLTPKKFQKEYGTDGLFSKVKRNHDNDRYQE